MAHGYIGFLIGNGPGDSNTTVDLVLRNSFGTQLASANEVSPGQLQAVPGSTPPRLEYPLIQTTFQHNGSNSWSEPLELQVTVNRDGNTTLNQEFETFVFNAPQGPLSDGDKLTINAVKMTYSGHPGTVAIVDDGGLNFVDLRFRLKDGGVVEDTSSVNAIGYTGSQNQLNSDANLEFTNNSGSSWNVDGLECQARDSGGTWRTIDEASFSSTSVGPNATIRFTDITHNFNYP